MIDVGEYENNMRIGIVLLQVKSGRALSLSLIAVVINWSVTFLNEIGFINASDISSESYQYPASFKMKPACKS